MDEKELELVIVSPEKTIFKGYVKWVDLPGEVGRFQVLINHAPIVSSLIAGEIKYQCGDAHFRVKRDVQVLEIKGGFVEVKNNQVSVCVEI